MEQLAVQINGGTIMAGLGNGSSPASLHATVHLSRAAQQGPTTGREYRPGESSTRVVGCSGLRRDP
jgi:hypothetical protein